MTAGPDHPAAFFRRCLSPVRSMRHPFVPGIRQKAPVIPLRNQAANLTDEVTWSEVLEPNSRFCASYLGWPFRYRTRFIGPPICRQQTGNTHAGKRPEFARCLLSARASWMESQTQGGSTPRWFRCVRRTKARLILPCFNDFVDGGSQNNVGWLGRGSQCRDVQQQIPESNLASRRIR